jgi:hypothetical protein
MDELNMNKGYLLAGISMSMYKCFNTPGNKTAARVDVIKAGLNRFLLLQI